MAQQLRRPRLEVADILYRRVHRPSAAQLRVMRRLEVCRTATLGGHRDTCGRCGHVRISYNSCRDRHCPKCQSLEKAEWVERRVERLLPAPHFHLVFTIPHDLNPLALRNKRVVFDLLFEAAARTLQTLARDPKHLGAQIGFTAILHTWGQNLLFHPHLHVLIAGGGLTLDGKHWVATRPGFFLPVKVLEKLFRGKFLDALRAAYEKGSLELKGSTQHLKERSAWKSLIDQLYRKDWVVYAKPPFGGPEHVLRYLGRYTHRVAISNGRLLAMEDGRVTFRIKDYTDGNRKKTLTLAAQEFIRRFLLHVLPTNFVRIRHYGLCAGRNVKTKLERARKLIETTSAVPSRKKTELKHQSPWWERVFTLFDIDIMLCPRCGIGRLVPGPLFGIGFRKWEAPTWDTS